MSFHTGDNSCGELHACYSCTAVSTAGETADRLLPARSHAETPTSTRGAKVQTSRSLPLGGEHEPRGHEPDADEEVVVPQVTDQRDVGVLAGHVVDDDPDEPDEEAAEHPDDHSAAAAQRSALVREQHEA